MRSALALGFGLAGILVASCGGEAKAPESPPSPTAAPANGTSAAVSQTAKHEAPGKTGVDREALDPATPACEDFYQYACGGWIKKTEIPRDESNWYRSFSVIRDRNEEILKGILEGYAKGEGTSEPYAKVLGDYYASCMDEGAIEAAGTKPLDPWLKAVDEVKDPASLTKLLGRLQLEQDTAFVFDIGASQDFNDSSKVVGMIAQSGLGMPEREYYLENTPKMVELRTKYEAHVAAMLGLGGDKNAKANATKVLAIETALAKAWMTKEDRREPKKMNHPASRAELAKVAPGINWDAWLEGAGAKDLKAFNVNQPDFMKELGAMIGGKVSLADWKTYLRWKLYSHNANELPAKFVDERFNWRRTLVGAQTLPDRWKRCTRKVDGGMGEALAQPFVKKTLGAEGKATVVDMVKAIERAMHENLEKLAWMDEPTRKGAFAKLTKIANKIAYPDKWRAYDGIGIDRSSYLANSLRAAQFEYKRQLAKIGKPVDRSEWQMSPPTVNAYYDGQLNEMVFPAGILQPPFFANAAPKATNFGAIGMVMGHELTHGFDDEGRQFDADGNLKDWWSERVNVEFERRAECVKKQYDEYTVLDGLHVNGKLTLGENIADLGGLKLAYRAFVADAAKSKGANAGKPEFTPAQEYFLGFAQGWCGKIRDEALRHQVSTNPHSPAHLRVNGPVSNLPEFAEAFGCKAGAKMVRKDRCEIW